MAIFLPGTAEDQALALDEMTPREIVTELDKYVVGQHAAKRAVAIALRNRMRRQKLPPELADEIMPKNIIMIGPTGVGKTEIARRLAKLTNSPFLKVEASKFTEVGYVGRDVESIVRDLVEIAIDMVREEKLEEVEDKAELAAEDQAARSAVAACAFRWDVGECDGCECGSGEAGAGNECDPAAGVDGRRPQLMVPRTKPDTDRDSAGATREKLRQQFREGKLDERMVELDVRDRNQPSFEVSTNQGSEEMDIQA